MRVQRFSKVLVGVAVVCFNVAMLTLAYTSLATPNVLLPVSGELGWWRENEPAVFWLYYATSRATFLTLCGLLSCYLWEKTESRRHRAR